MLTHFIQKKGSGRLFIKPENMKYMIGKNKHLHAALKFPIRQINIRRKPAQKKTSEEAGIKNLHSEVVIPRRLHTGNRRNDDF